MRQVGYLPELYEVARSEKYKKIDWLVYRLQFPQLQNKREKLSRYMTIFRLITIANCSLYLTENSLTS